MALITFESEDIVKDTMDGIIYDINHFTGKKCVIAGGAVRDWLLGKNGKDVKIKDYDVFVLDGLKVKASVFQGLGGWKLIGQYPWPIGEYKFNGEVVQVMVTKCATPEELMKTFDWDICMAWYDGKQWDNRFLIADVVNGTWKMEAYNTNEYSLARGLDFHNRYGLDIEHNTLMKLVQDKGIKKVGVGVSKVEKWEAYKKWQAGTTYPDTTKSGYTDLININNTIAEPEWKF